MGHMPLLYSMLFFAAFAVYLFFGLYIIHMNPRARINRHFLVVCISLGIWAFGFSIANSASAVEICLLWRRVSALGWATIYSSLLNFILLLTGKSNLIKRWYLWLMIYLPAFITLYVFSLSKGMVTVQYNLVKTDFGWTNVAVHNGWDIFFYFYYAGYVLACIVSVWQWKQRSADSNIHKQANLIIGSLFIAMLLGSMTDVVLSSILKNQLPQMAPVFTLIPIIAIYYSIRNYGLLHHKAVNKGEQILNEETRTKLFHYLSIAFFAGGLLGFVSEYLPQILNGNSSIKSALWTTGMLFGLGFFIQIFQTIKDDGMKNFATMGVLIVSIPLITVQFFKYASITVWAFPIIIMIISLVFNEQRLLISTAAVAIATQAFIWLFQPSVIVKVDHFDYILRIGIFIIALWIGLVVNKIFVAKIQENAYQINFQKIISEISFEFVSINQENFDKKTNTMLEKTGRFFQVDRTYAFLFNHQNMTMTYTHEWCNEGIEPEIDTIQEVPIDMFPWWMGQLNNNKVVYIENISSLPDTAGAEKEQLARQSIKSLVSIPIEVDGEVQGFLGIDSVLSFKKWSDEHIKSLKILANLLADGLIKIKAEKEIEFMAYYDHLTGLPNRTLFADRANQAIQLAKRSGKYVAIIFMDLDRFKAVNDTLGHSGGDLLIKNVAKGLVSRLRKTDTVARFGGDEFLIMINNIADRKEVIKVADNLMEMFVKPFNILEHDFFITGSAGIAVYPIDGEDTETLTKNADIAMYKAKSQGKNQYVLCTKDMKDEVQKNMILSNDLYRAQERNELVIYYQPQIKLHSGQVIGMEALLRWQHPQIGMISPSVFIPLAEKNGLISSIGEWVLKEACLQNKKWQDMGLPHLRMAVNLSINQFNDIRLVDSVENILKETGLNPKYLELEITESIAINEASYIIDILGSLKKLGVSISIDDFGTEYSSLSRLKTLPLDRIKIDMQFVQGIEGSEKDQAITKVIINLAKSLELEVVAEGVETSLQSDFLNSKMCDEAQGFYYYKPMPAEQIEKLLRLY